MEPGSRNLVRIESEKVPKVLLPEDACGRVLHVGGRGLSPTRRSPRHYLLGKAGREPELVSVALWVSTHAALGNACRAPWKTPQSGQHPFFLISFLGWEHLTPSPVCNQPRPLKEKSYWCWPHTAPSHSPAAGELRGGMQASAPGAAR